MCSLPFINPAFNSSQSTMISSTIIHHSQSLNKNLIVDMLWTPCQNCRGHYYYWILLLKLSKSNSGPIDSSYTILIENLHKKKIAIRLNAFLNPLIYFKISISTSSSGILFNTPLLLFAFLNPLIYIKNSICTSSSGIWWNTPLLLLPVGRYFMIYLWYIHI